MRPDRFNTDYLARPPRSELSRWVEELWCFEAKASIRTAGALLVVPDGRPEVIVHYRTPFIRTQAGNTAEDPSAFVFGQLTEPIELASQGPVGVVGARLRPEGLHLLGFGNASEATNQAVALGDLGELGKSISGRVRKASGRSERLSVLESLLLRRAENVGNRASLVSAAVARIRGTGGRERVENTATSLGVSRRHLERQFQTYVGIGPKSFARLERFGHLLQATFEQEVSSWVDLALDHGYYDQSHLWRDFQSFAGRSASGLQEANTQLLALFGQSYGSAQAPGES